jgi:hypothetical protein
MRLVVEMRISLCENDDEESNSGKRPEPKN